MYQAVIARIRKGQRLFRYADWRHKYKRDGEYVYDSHGAETMCEGDRRGCSYCHAVIDDAAAAYDLADRAMEAISAGDVREAATLIASAAAIEQTWGDAPAYGPAMVALCEHIAAAQ
jgi:hypothetical protein